MESNFILFNSIVDDLVEKNYSLQIQKAPKQICLDLLEQAKNNTDKFNLAAMGRIKSKVKDKSIRRDKIKWITGETQAELNWLSWCEELRVHLNRSLFLGLNNFECHFSMYEPGDFYKKHVDAFKGKSNRIVSMVLYLNENWLPQHKGELVIYPENQLPIKVEPTLASFIVFLSECIPHEVVASRFDRYAIACWFRIDDVKSAVKPL